MRRDERRRRGFDGRRIRSTPYVDGSSAAASLASPIRIQLRRCVSELSLSDESPRRHEKLTEGVNLKSVSFMSQFHSSRPDCNLYASWVRFLQTKKYCVLLYIKEKILKKLSKQQLSPLCDLDQALRFACVDRGQTENSCCSQTENICCVKCPFCEWFACVDRNVPWRESMSSEEFQILQVHKIYQADIILHRLARKFTEESKIRYAWSKYDELERSLAETELARTIFELAISQYEEYIDYLYPEESQTTNLKILEAAYKWKKQKLAASEEDYNYYQVSFESYQNYL
ncbi:hypothetical protein Bca52824_051183 [Brassica carinata]|uniref:Uncharacterized protein n=1 Tax=Brassica carinata TaxID=52824 RepID=A0A8X7R4Z2_BRACI|nr:hypothetical protein Bca52824_051183 [Brassica carinata]